MLISTKGRYALRVLIDMAEHGGDSFIPLSDVARRQDISEKYLESIVRSLVKAGILAGMRGKGGGYRLCKKPEDITVFSVLNLTEGELSPVACLAEGSTPCPRMASCRTLPLWDGLNRLICDYLNNHTIADLTRKDEAGDDYII